MRKFFAALVLLVLCITGNQARAQFVRNVSKVGTTAAAFLEIEVGGRALGMGGGFVGHANDASALYWNVGGISRLPRNELLLSHTQWLADIRFDYAGFVLKLGPDRALGISLTSMTMGEMEVRTVFYPEGTGERFTAGSFALAGSYGWNLTDRFSIGFTAKYVHETVWHMRANGFAVDVGTLFTTQFHGMRLGMSISNFGTKMRLEGKDTQVTHDIDPVKTGNNERILAHLDTDRWPMPLIFRVGIGAELFQDSWNRLSVGIDAVHPNDNTEYVNLGLEYAFRGYFFARAGYKSLFLRDGEEGFTAGFGLRYPVTPSLVVKADVAYCDFGRLDSVQKVSLSLEF
ncbi:MAG: PorV/PorQ family protein [candidate division KSB1 bacterium]|nr:PorV/PorQ family protein [candidate division KSB1 bacterium]